MFIGPSHCEKYFPCKKSRIFKRHKYINIPALTIEQMIEVNSLMVADDGKCKAEPGRPNEAVIRGFSFYANSLRTVWTREQWRRCNGRRPASVQPRHKSACHAVGGPAESFSCKAIVNSGKFGIAEREKRKPVPVGCHH